MIGCIENSKRLIKKFLALKDDYVKDARYNVNIQKSITFLYTNNEQVEFEIKNSIPFTLTLQNMKYLGINLTKYIQDLYEGNCQFLMKKSKN